MVMTIPDASPDASADAQVTYANVIEPILRNMERQGRRPAIRHRGETLTYADLGRRSNAVAAELIRRSVAPGTLVPIVTTGGIEMICAMIGILRAGAAFVPIDLCAPRARIDDMLETLAAPLTIVDSAQYQSLGDGEGTVCVSALPQPAGKIARIGDADGLAYGFFTSGSTGKPKCCLNIHKGLANRFQVMTQVFGLAPGEAVLQNSKHTFDSSLWQILWPLASGGTVVVPDRDGLLDIRETIDTIAQNDVVMTDFVPSIFDVFLSYLEAHGDVAARLRSMRHILVGGEEVSAKIINRCAKVLPWIRVTNTYGPTEASIGMVFHHFDAEQSDPVPLGTPIANTRAIVVDERLMPVQDGVIGQIVIGGACMGLGYLKDEEKTRRAFLHAPHLELGSDVVFQTGDLGRVENGLFYFHGRIDNQVKIMGVRIELNEIEHHLEEIDGIEQARVVTRDDTDGHTTLAAFVVSSRPVDAPRLRAELAGTLPKEAVPASFHTLEEFPRTASGKIDRRALKAMANTQTNEVAGARADRTGDAQAAGTREWIAVLVRRYCKSDTVGAHDNIFESGLDSLNAIKLALEMETGLNVALSSACLYANPSIAALTGLVDRRARSRAGEGGGANAAEVAGAFEEDLERLRTLRIPGIFDAAAVLLTGATGYVGIHVLRELLATTRKTVLCMVRAQDGDSALERMRASARAQNIEEEIDWGRVEPVCGDLGQPMGAIGPSRWRDMGRRVSEIYHMAAEVNFVKPYAELKAANIEGTATLAGFALEYGIGHFHHASTTSVIPVDGDLLTHPFELTRYPRDGYSQSKLAAENLVFRLGQQGIGTSIYRLGEVMPSRAYPATNPKALTTQVLRSFLELQLAYDSQEHLDYSPVDVVSKIIAGPRKGRCRAFGPTLVVDASNPTSLCLNKLKAGFDRAGLKVTHASKSEFYDQLRRRCQEADTCDSCLIVNDMIREAQDCGQWSLFSLAGGARNDVPTPADQHVDWPVVDDAYLGPILEKMAREAAP